MQNVLPLTRNKCFSTPTTTTTISTNTFTNTTATATATTTTTDTITNTTTTSIINTTVYLLTNFKIDDFRLKIQITIFAINARVIGRTVTADFCLIVAYQTFASASIQTCRRTTRLDF